MEIGVVRVRSNEQETFCIMKLLNFLILIPLTLVMKIGIL